jgi:murein L,D-transpeptidase YafK
MVVMQRFLNVSNLILVSFLYSSIWGTTALADAAKTSDPVAVNPPKDQIPENLVALDTYETHGQHIFIADKSTRTLTVWTNQKTGPELYGAYPMDIGKSSGDKSSEGDHRTPEGIYIMQERREGRKEIDFDLYGTRAFTLDYPNYFDKLAKKTGSGVWFHAVPDTTSLNRGSRGCVVVRNEIIDKLTPLINLKSTPILILDKVTYASREKLETDSQEVKNWLTQWRTDWESKNIEAYMAHYSDQFYSMKMNKKKWQAYKTALNEKYKYIKVKFKEPFMLARKDEAIVSFIQDYESDGLKDMGEKVLYLKKVAAGKYTIVTELWRPLSQDLLAHKPFEEKDSGISQTAKTE